MGSHRIASRYAKSLIQLAEEKGKLDEVFADMKSIDGIFENNRDLKLVFRSPIIPADKKLTIVKKIFEGKINDILFRFLTLMIKKGREEHFHEMVESFILQYNVIKEITPVKITSAVKLDAGLTKGAASPVPRSCLPAFASSGLRCPEIRRVGVGDPCRSCLSCRSSPCPW